MNFMGGGLPPQRPGGASDVIDVSERDFEQEVVHAETPVLIALVSERSAVSKQTAPELDAFAREVKGKVKVIRVDIDRSPNIARELRIQQVPTFIVFADRKIADAVAGPATKKSLLALVEPHLPRAAGAMKTSELAQMLSAGVFVPVDTREAAAFKRAHLPGAVNVPVEELETRLADLEALDGRPILYCRSGDKSKEAAAKLGDLGFPVAYLEGGLLSWEADSLPIERG